eukprot:3264952-Pleurochrysis_carterae.AAC.1
MATQGGAPAQAEAERERGGMLAQGAALAGEVREAVATARRAPAAFASMRNREPECEERLAAEPLPGDLFAPQPTAREGKRARAKARKPLPRGDAGRPGDAQAPRGGAARPPGDVEISQLFQAGIYEARVQRWFAAADAAVAALRQRAAGEEVDVPDVPTVVIEQEEMVEWARGTVWDCADPQRCTP